MTKMTYAVLNDAGGPTVYRGFEHWGGSQQLKPGMSVLCVWTDGEPDLYLTDDPELGRSELLRYLQESGWDPGFIGGIFVLEQTSDAALAKRLEHRMKADDSQRLREQVMKAFIAADDHGRPA